VRVEDWLLLSQHRLKQDHTFCAESLIRIPYWSKSAVVDRVALPLPFSATCVSIPLPKRDGSKCLAGGGGNSPSSPFFQKASDGSFGFANSTDLQPKAVTNPKHRSKVSAVFDAFNDIGIPVEINFNEPKVASEICQNQLAIFDRIAGRVGGSPPCVNID